MIPPSSPALVGFHWPWLDNPHRRRCFRSPQATLPPKNLHFHQVQVDGINCLFVFFSKKKELFLHSKTASSLLKKGTYFRICIVFIQGYYKHNNMRSSIYRTKGPITYFQRTYCIFSQFWKKLYVVNACSNFTKEWSSNK